MENIFNFYLNYVVGFVNFLKEDLPPGPKLFPLNWMINFQKGVYIELIFMLF